MLRRWLIGGLVTAIAAHAALLPDHVGPHPRTAIQPVQFSGGKAVADEYGLTAAEQAAYGALTLTAYQFRDPTGALAAAQLLGPGAALDGNYVLTCSGRCPASSQLPTLAGTLPGLRRGLYPMLPGWLPKTGLVANSERYVLGPASLAAFAPRVPGAVVGFQFSPEAQAAVYRRGGAEETLVLFSYPSPSIARQQAAQLRSVSGATVQRDGPLVAVLFGAPDANAAKLLLDGIRYSAAVTRSQPMPLQVSPQSAVKMVLAGFELAGILLLFCLFSGLLFGFGRVLSKRFGSRNADEPMVLLHLADK